LSDSFARNQWGFVSTVSRELGIYGETDLHFFYVCRKTLEDKRAVELRPIHARHGAIEKKAASSRNDGHINSHQLHIFRTDLMKALSIPREDSSVSECGRAQRSD